MILSFFFNLKIIKFEKGHLSLSYCYDSIFLYEDYSLNKVNYPKEKLL